MLTSNVQKLFARRGDLLVARLRGPREGEPRARMLERLHPGLYRARGTER
jgi:hypothetical protein